LIDDQPLVRTGLRALLERDPAIEIVGEAGDGHSGVRLVQRTRPDVVLMDIRMPQMDGLAATRAIVAEPGLDDTKVVVLTTFGEHAEIEGAIRAGAAGYLLKDISPEELRRAGLVLAGGDALISPAITRRVMQKLAAGEGARTAPTLLDELTERAQEVLRHV